MTLSSHYIQARYNKKNKKAIYDSFQLYYSKNKDRYLETSKRNRRRKRVTKADIDEMKKRYPFCFYEIK
jgi:hypothetical protein